MTRVWLFICNSTYVLTYYLHITPDYSGILEVMCGQILGSYCSHRSSYGLPNMESNLYNLNRSTHIKEFSIDETYVFKLVQSSNNVCILNYLLTLNYFLYCKIKYNSCKLCPLITLATVAMHIKHLIFCVIVMLVLPPNAV